ncbi:hypothetical protein ES288_A12G193900v1 [Gossypium darwinii]|uniref:Uncharacterized protein n=1 Tax=Gossypium darwinii TaxID=34276 RepID=A0A5D2EAR9_GOSDA|nr:hypothetical protein ES288_A12G193900v1 [Gossypium darwinii]
MIYDSFSFYNRIQRFFFVPLFAIVFLCFHAGTGVCIGMYRGTERVRVEVVVAVGARRPTRRHKWRWGWLRRKSGNPRVS